MRKWFVPGQSAAIEQDVQVVKTTRVSFDPASGDMVTVLCQSTVEQVLGDEVVLGPLTVLRIEGVERHR